MLSELAAGAARAGERVETGGRVAFRGDGQLVIEHGGVRLSVVAATPGFDVGAQPGAWVTVLGTYDGERLHAQSVRVDTAAAPDFGRASSEALWGQRGVAMLQQRDVLQQTVRAFFASRGFTEVETPVVVRNPGLELQLDALEVHGLPGSDPPRYLHTSPEYHMKRLLGAGLPRLYQLCPAHRRGELGPLHEPAFTMLEWYRAFADSGELMADTERLVADAARALCGATRVTTAFGEVELAPPWERLTVADAFTRYAGVDMATLLPDEEAYYRVLVERVEPQLGRGRPTLLTHYPASMAALARLHDDDPRFADRFEAYVCGVELCNGFGELTDAAEQRRRFEAELSARARAGRACPPIDERFLGALADGLPPCAGNALGFDRLLMLLLGERRIADVMAFAQERA